MKIFYKLFCPGILLIFLNSCVTTNNLYVNNPVPMGKGESEFYIGLGTGVTAKIDTILPESGKIRFSNAISSSPVLSAGLQGGISNQTDLRLAIHFPSVGGSIGLRAGVQHSFFDLHSQVNVAVGTDLGFVFASDTMTILGIETTIDKVANSALNADVFLPVSFRVNNNFSLVITPRYSFNTIYVREFENEHNAFPFKFKYPVLSLGIRAKKIYFEMTMLSFHHELYPHFGMAWMI